MIYWPAKVPASIADYSIDFAERLAEGETITGHTVTVTGVTKDSDVLDGSAVIVWVSGGTEGTLAHVTITVTTSGGRTFQVLALLPIGCGPVSLSEAKAHLRVEHDAEDALIQTYLDAAIQAIENATGQVLRIREAVQRFKLFGEQLTLLRGPVRAVTSVGYRDSQGGDAVLASYRLIEADPAYLLPALGESFPTVEANTPAAITVTYQAGYDPADVPVALKQAVLLTLTSFYENRGGGEKDPPMPRPAMALIGPYRPLGIA